MNIETILEIASDLEGTCQSIDEAFEKRGFEFLETDICLLQRLDDEVFCCETCSWWCPVSEHKEDGKCADCCEERE